jgi:uncharacterized repeat protein (TIGR01451 family)/fimbrial isopeptide formation D2 family protein
MKMGVFLSAKTNLAPAPMLKDTVSNLWTKLVIAALVPLALLLGSASFVLAADKFCSEYGGVVDGDVLGISPVQITINTTCTFQNWPPSNPLTATINFQTNDPSIYLIVFDNVMYEGNMACSNIDHKLWVVNSEEGAFSGACQNIIIPAETINKQTPAATATIGLPFTYTLTIPSMQFPVGASSPNDLGSIHVSDDLTATGAALTLVGLNAYYKGSGTQVPITNNGDDKHLDFMLPNLQAGEQIVVEVTVVLDDTPTNMPGMPFTNTAVWQFSRWIDLDEDGIQDANEFFNPLPGESGTSAPMTIVAPNLVVNKTSPATAINVTDTAAFTIDVQNSGGGNAWNATILDQLPVGMCSTDPSDMLSVRTVAADGTTLIQTFAPGFDYTVSPAPYGGGCQFSLTMTDAAGPIAPEQHLIITYQTQLDNGFTDDGAMLTNVAGVTRWFSADSSHAGRREFARSLTDGTPGIIDHQDNQTVTAALHGYYFEKTVQNLTSLANPATTAAPGDTLRYRLRVFNVDQEINTVTIIDQLDLSAFDPTTFGNVAMVTGTGYSATWNFDSISGELQIEGAPTLNVNVHGELVVEFDISLRTDLASGTTVANQATLTAAGSFTALSDDPYINGVASPDEMGDEDATVVLITTPGPLAKTNTQATATIGERFEYTLTVPATPTSVPLYDVRILDTLPANLRFVSARVVSGGAWSLSNSGIGNALLIEDTVTGIDIPAGSQAKIAIMVELLNSAPNQSSVTFTNSATYTYNRANGVDTTELAGGGNITPNMTVVEPLLAVVKSVSFASPAGKPASDPATVGDVLEYEVTISNNGTSTAFDVNILDTLPANVALVAGSATATIGGVAVAEFVADPAALSGTILIWGRDNGDGNLDIPVGQSLVLTYPVTVVDASSVSSFSNSVYVDWTSLDEDYPIDSSNPAPGRERTGADGIAGLNNYVTGPASVTVYTVDNTSIVKSVNSDSYAEIPSGTVDPIVRVGDTVTYDLTLNLQEYTTRNVVVEDALPAGMALQSFSVLGGANFSYTLGIMPPVDATGTLRWEFGDIINTPNGVLTDDVLIIRYVAEVVTDPTLGVDSDPSNLLDNHAKLSYTGGDPLSTNPQVQARLNTTARIDVRQPQMSLISKVDLGTGRTGSGTAIDPYQVNIIDDIMQFQLKSCNTNGLAPAYGLQITDLLASQLNESSVTTPVVAVGGTALTGTDYTYTYDNTTRIMNFVLSKPVDPDQCVTVDYNLGFHNDIPAGQTWSNQARLSQYGSLPADGRLYTSTAAAQIWMTNQVSVQPLTKTLMSPAEATIGETVTYQITVPGTPVNAALSNVVVTDTLEASLTYVSATLAAPFTLTDSSVGQDVSLAIAQIPAGEQAVITLTARVANNATANAGFSSTNTAAYSYTGMPPGSVTSGSSSPLTIVEPAVTVDKTVSPTTPPTAGDILTYRVDLTAISGANYSSAYDLLLADTLGSGLAYVAGSSTINGISVADPAIIDQTLSWADGIDIPEGTTVSLLYKVQVLDSVTIGQVLANSVVARWTSLDDASPDERTGSGTAPNDYLASDTTSLTITDSTLLAKSLLSDTYNASDGNVRVGDLIDYELRLGLQEGTHTALVLTDTLPAGMAFAGMVSAEFFGTSGAATPAVSGQTLTWNLGTVVNPGDENPANDYLVLSYRARVLNNDALPQQSSLPLTNDAHLDYTIGGVPATRLTASQMITVQQPILAVSKAAAPAGGDTFINADEVISYMVNIENSGAAPAYDTILVDTLPVGLRQGGVTTTSITLVGTGTNLPLLSPAYDPASGEATWNFDNNTANTYTIPAGETLRLIYTVEADANLGPGLTLTNTAQAMLYYSFDDEAVPANGSVVDREIYGPTNTAQQTLITPLPGGLLKQNPLNPTATIGQEFTYTITVPAIPQATALHDVRILDNLGAVNANLTLVSISKVSGSQAWTPSNTGTGSDLVIEDTTSGIEIPANEQIVVGVTVRMNNDGINTDSLTFANAASYTYNQLDGDATTRKSGAGSSVTANMRVVESKLTAAKGAINATPGKAAGAPISGGDILQYVVTINNIGSATAYDVNVVDTLPSTLAFYNAYPPTATINGSAVSGFVATPAGLPGSTLVWGRGNGDGSLDIPAGGVLVLTYRAQVLESAATTFTNQVWVDWTSLNDANAYERTGVDGIGGLNDYVTGPASVTTTTIDSNSLIKAIIADTYIDAPSTAIDKIVRLGDTVTYRLTLSLGEGTTRSVKVQDVLPPGMAYDSLVGIVPASGSGSFTYSVGSQPVSGATGPLTWDLGTVVNTPSNNGTSVDTLIIEYKATVLPDAGIVQDPTTSLINTATLSYQDASGNPVVKPVASDTLALRQPVMSPLVKLGNGAVNTAATPLNVDVATAVVHFQLRSCNTDGLAPAYSVQLTDVLPSQLDESSLTVPVVAVGGIPLTAGTDYTYTPPAARGGSMSFGLNTPVTPGQCVTVDYNIGFHTDFGPNQTWNNTTTLDEYWSLPVSSGQKYAPSSSQFYMTNQVSVTPLSKTLVSPAEATVGEEVVYRIVVPGTAVSAALDNVVVNDTLHGALGYVSATATLNGAPLSITPTLSGQSLTWALGTIAAGQQAVITLTTRVDNNPVANAGTSITNTAFYTCTDFTDGSATSGTSSPLTLVEPAVAVTKTAANVTQPGTAPKAGDILRYTLTLTAASGTSFSGAFDAGLVDSLSLGLAYQAGTSSINGTGNTIINPTVLGDGNTTPQTLAWDLASSTADIDVVEGATVSIAYDVLVLDTVVAGQILTNSVTVQWTGLEGTNIHERTGADGSTGLNDYVASAAAPPLTVPIPTLTLQKVVDKPVANPGDTLHYTLTLQNPNGIRVANFGLVDALSTMFQSGSISNVVVPSGAMFEIIDSTLSVKDLNIGPNETLTIDFEILLKTDLKSGTVVLNQAELQGPWPTPIKSDDPNVPGAANPTQTVIPANGVAYDAETRKPLSGLTLTMQLAGTGSDLPASCFVDPSQQNQTTPASGEYKFDLNFDPSSCPEGADYLIAVSAAPAGYLAEPSLILKPITSAATAAYSVPVCSDDAIPATPQCEAHSSTTVPTGPVSSYYLHLRLDSTANQLYNNHIPVDPKIEEKIYITKKSPLVNVTRGQLVPYAITVKNTLRSALPALGIVDLLPPGFKYVEGSSRYDEIPFESVLNGRQLRWDNLDIGYKQEHTIRLLLLVGAGVSEGEYVNRAYVFNSTTDEPFSEVATATVRVTPDATFDCTDVIGKVFDDRNLNGQQDAGEEGLAGVRVVTARGLIATTDAHGRFHITCAVVPDEDRGSNFILKLDDRTLPTGYRLTTENPRVQRATRGKALRFPFGATIHHLVSMDIADGVFEPEKTTLRLQWQPKIDQLLAELKKGPSVLRLSYLADVEPEELVKKRLKALKKEIDRRWKTSAGGYRLDMETEVFWRRGRPL